LDSITDLPLTKVEDQNQAVTSPPVGGPKPSEISYFVEAKQYIDNLPRSFAAIRVSQKAKGEDPLPFSLQSDGTDTFVYFPAKIPDEKKDECLPSLAALLALCSKAKLKVKSTERDIDNSFWNLISALKDSIFGALYCLGAKDIAPSTNVPSAHKRGWDFALWYCYAAFSKSTDHSEFLSIPRVVTMQSADKGQWSQTQGKFTDLDRLNTLVRTLAQKDQFVSKLADTKYFLKAEGYFVNRLVGKKPISGLYTSSEFTILKKEWETRCQAVSNNYKELLKYNVKSKPVPPGYTFNKLIAKCAVPLSSLSKKIEEAKTKRIPELLVIEGRGRSSKKVIAKGNDLPEKLRNINGGESVRTIAKVLYSPQCAVSLSDWSSSIMSEARSRNLKEEKTPFDRLDDLVSKGSPSQLQLALYSEFSNMEVAIQTYLEVLPDRIGNTAWDSTFGITKRK